MMMAFPNARQSLRQWSNIDGRGTGGDSKIPVPVAVELHNFLPPVVVGPSTTSPPTFAVSTNTNANDVLVQVTPGKITAYRDDCNDQAATITSTTPVIQNHKVDVTTTILEGVGDNNDALLIPSPSVDEQSSEILMSHLHRYDDSYDDEHDYDHENYSDGAASTRWYRPQHDANLLPLLRLDIVAKAHTSTNEQQQQESEAPSSPLSSVSNEGGGSSGGDDADASSPSSTRGVISCYSQETRTPAVHPSWEHLGERIRVPSSSLSDAGSNLSYNRRPWWEQNDLYKSMRIKLFIIPSRDRREGLQHHSVESSKTNDATTTAGTRGIVSSPVCFMDVPLHPSQLHRIDDFGCSGSQKDASSKFASNDNIETTSSSDPDDSSNKLANLRLPPNSILVHYSDGSVRCPLSLFQTLWDTDQLDEEPPVEDFSRFEDDVFKTLDHVEQTPQRRERTASSLLDHDEELDAAERNKPHKSPLVSYKPPASPSLMALTTEGGGVGISKDTDTKERTAANHASTLEEQTLPPLSIPFPENGEIDASEADLLSHREMLLKLIDFEHQAMEQDYRELQDEKLALAAMMHESITLEKETGLVRTELRLQEQILQREEFYGQSLSVKLIRDLSSVYPITLSTFKNGTAGDSENGNGGGGGGRGYLIRGLRLPVDIYTTTVPEEEVSASLGYCAHLVFMIAKYLNISLRHRILCNSSRSAIQQDGSGVFPLFLGRMNVKALEREQVDKGLRLLGANVNCILMYLGLLPTSHTNIASAEDGSRVIMGGPTPGKHLLRDHHQQQHRNQVLEQSHILSRLAAVLKFVSTGET
jgi:Vacuolar sorting 38 and autophagy-related subunit 14